MITVDYKGKTLAALAPGKKAILKCANMLMEDNVVITVPEPTGGGGGLGLYKFNDTISHTGMKECEIGEINAVLETLDPITIYIYGPDGEGSVDIYPIFVYDSLIKQTYLYTVYLQQGIAEPIRVYYYDGETSTFFSYLNELGAFKLESVGEFSEWFYANTTPIGGECSGQHVIEVTDLPTDNIDMNAIYKCNGRFYTRSSEKLREVAMYTEDAGIWLLSSLAGMTPGAGVYYYTVPELPADGGVITDEKLEILHIYYVERDKNLYLYMADGWVLASEEQALNIPYLGVVSDISEIPTTEEGIYAIVYAAWDELVRGSAVVEVSELPTENISESAVYWCNGQFHKYGTTFFDIAFVSDEGGSVYPLMLLLSIAKVEFSYNFIPTKTTEGIKASINADSAADSTMHFYFIGDEKDEPVFLYINDAWVPLSQMSSLNAVLAAAASSEDISYDVSAHEDTTLMYQGVIGTYDEAISMGYYVVGTCGWNAYMKPVGTFIFEKNNQISDVSTFKKAAVAIPDPPAVPISYLVPRMVEELPIDAPEGSMAIVFRR
jgi:hypothetical protein